MTFDRWSEILQMRCALDREQQRVTTADGVMYDRSELAALKGCHPELIRAVHTAKRILAGVVVEGPGSSRPRGQP